MEADINFSIEDYEDDLKQVKKKDEVEEERDCCYLIFNSACFLTNLILYSCSVLDMLFFFLFFFFMFLLLKNKGKKKHSHHNGSYKREIRFLCMVIIIDEQPYQGRICSCSSPTKHWIS